MIPTAYKITLLLLLAIIAVRIICHSKGMTARSVSLRHWLMIMLIPVLSIAICLGLSNALGRNMMRSFAPPIFVPACITGINVIAFIIFDKLSEQSKILIENERARNRLESDIIQCNSAVSQSKECAALLHDFRRHNEAVYGLLSTGDSSAALRYVGGLLAEQSPLDNDIIVRNEPAVNMMLRRKTAEAEQHAVSVICNYEAGILPVDDVSLEKYVSFLDEMKSSIIIRYYFKGLSWDDMEVQSGMNKRTLQRYRDSAVDQLASMYSYMAELENKAG